MNKQMDFEDFKQFLKRRGKLCLFTFCSIFTLAVIYAVVLPPIYRSEATIRITEQQISEDYIKSVMDFTPEERLQSLTGEVMSHTKLQEIIKEHKLYPELQRKGAMSDAVDEIKDAIMIEPLITEVVNPRSGRTMPVTTALILSFQGNTPEQVKNVTQALSNLYIEEDIRKREEFVAATTGFLEGELDRLKKYMKSQEEEISAFKTKHYGQLPENRTANRQTIAKLERDLDQADNRVRFLEDRKIYLNGQLANIEPLAPISTSQGVVIRNPKERLKVLQMELVQLQTRLSDKHPDVIRVKREVNELQKKLGTNASQINKEKLLKQKKAELVELEEKFDDKHPDIKKLKREISALSKLTKNSGKITTGYDKPDNPAYINILTQVKAADAEIRSLANSKADIKSELTKYRDLMKNASVVESKINEMMRSYENTQKNYNELMDKLMGARVSQAIEKKDRGTKFIITEPAYLPNSPFKPNRIAIVFLGFILASGASIGIAAAREATDRSIKSERDLARITDIPILSTITLVGDGKKTKKKRSRGWD